MCLVPFTDSSISTNSLTRFALSSLLRGVGGQHSHARERNDDTRTPSPVCVPSGRAPLCTSLSARPSLRLTSLRLTSLRIPVLRHTALRHLFASLGARHYHQYWLAVCRQGQNHCECCIGCARVAMPDHQTQFCQRWCYRSARLPALILFWKGTTCQILKVKLQSSLVQVAG